MALDLALKFYISVAKGLRIKSKTFSLLIPTFLEVSVDKLVGEWGGGAGGGGAYLMKKTFPNFVTFAQEIVIGKLDLLCSAPPPSQIG